MVTKLTYGSGLGEGISSFGASIGKALKERTERKQLQDILNPPQPEQQQVPADLTQDEGFQDKFMSMLQNYQDKTGEQLNPQQLDMAWKAQLQQAQQQQQPTGPRQYNVQQLAAIARKNPQLASMLQQNQLAQQKMTQQTELAKQKQFAEERKYQTARGLKGAERIAGVETSMGKKEMALDMARLAVESGEVGAFSKANLAQRLGIPELQTASGAALVTAGKENLLGNMSRVSARAQNIWFEKRLADMFPKIGQSKEANLTTQEMLEGEALIDRSLVEKYNQLEQEDIQKYGFAKGDVEKRARKEIEPLEKEIFNRTVYRMKQLEELEKNPIDQLRMVGKKVQSGTPLTLTMASNYIKKYGDLQKALSAARKNGYKIPTKQELTFYEKRPREAREAENEQ